MIGARAMSQLDLHIEQKIAQRDSIDLAARRLAGRPGWVIEFGLGRGRSYAHLVERFPDREIYCFDFRARVILAHLDLAWGEGDDATVHRLVLERTREWLLPGAWILSDRAVPLDPAWGLVPVPATAEVGHAHRYHRYELRVAP